MYTFLASLVSAPDFPIHINITTYLWVWGIGGVVGSFCVGPIISRIKGPVLTLYIMILLTLSLLSLPWLANVNEWLLMISVAIWGAVGWALQVPQNNELIYARAHKGDSNLAIALNESSLYLGSAIGAAAGGMILSFNLSIWVLASSAGAIAAVGVIVQTGNLRKT